MVVSAISCWSVCHIEEGAISVDGGKLSAGRVDTEFSVWVSNKVGSEGDRVPARKYRNPFLNILPENYAWLWDVSVYNWISLDTLGVKSMSWLAYYLNAGTIYWLHWPIWVAIQLLQTFRHNASSRATKPNLAWFVWIKHAFFQGRRKRQDSTPRPSA